MESSPDLYNENKMQTISEADTFSLERYTQFAGFIKDGMTVLDIGCNTGRGGIVLKNKFPALKLYGVELVVERLEKIPAGIFEEVHAQSITNWESGNLKFDRIIAGEVIEHIPLPEFKQMLNKCKLLLKPGGLIIFTTPNPDSLLVKIGRDSVFSDPSHVNIMSIPVFKNIVADAGLRIKAIKGSGKASRFLGPNIPFMPLYGSYLAVLSL